jgi:hypothetical protein
MLFILISQASFSLRRVGFLDATLRIREIGIISAFTAFIAISALAAVLSLQAEQSQSSPQVSQWPPSGRLSVFIRFAPTKESKILALAAALALQAGQSQWSPQEAQWPPSGRRVSSLLT